MLTLYFCLRRFDEFFAFTFKSNNYMGWSLAEHSFMLEIHFLYDSYVVTLSISPSVFPSDSPTW